MEIRVCRPAWEFASPFRPQLWLPGHPCQPRCGPLRHEFTAAVWKRWKPTLARGPRIKGHYPKAMYLTYLTDLTLTSPHFLFFCFVVCEELFVCFEVLLTRYLWRGYTVDTVHENIQFLCRSAEITPSVLVLAIKPTPYQTISVLGEHRPTSFSLPVFTGAIMEPTYVWVYVWV